MSGTKKDDRSKEGTGKSSPVSGAGLGMLSMINNKKIITVIGGILIVIGIAGLVLVIYSQITLQSQRAKARERRS